jgi:ABC-type transport system involved in Fe-S cluster assembly fused permease/ATPase subunit
MENGEIREVGEHNLLMTADGGYEKLFKTQKQLEEGYTL